MLRLTLRKERFESARDMGSTHPMYCSMGRAELRSLHIILKNLLCLLTLVGLQPSHQIPGCLYEQATRICFFLFRVKSRTSPKTERAELHSIYILSLAKRDHGP